MDERGRGKFKKGRSKWLEKYNSWSREVARCSDGGKNSCRVNKTRRRKRRISIKFLVNSLYNNLNFWI